MTAKIIPFPVRVHNDFDSSIEISDFNKLIQMRAEAIDHLHDLIRQGDQKAYQVLQDVGGSPLMEQLSALYREYPYWNEWKEIKKQVKPK